MFRCDILEQFQSKTHILEQPKLLKFVTFCISARFGQFESLKIEVNGSERKWTTSLVDLPQSHQQQPLLFVQHWSCDSLTTSYNIDGNTQQLSKQSSRHTHVAPMHCSICSSCFVWQLQFGPRTCILWRYTFKFFEMIESSRSWKIRVGQKPWFAYFCGYLRTFAGYLRTFAGLAPLEKIRQKKMVCVFWIEI